MPLGVALGLRACVRRDDATNRAADPSIDATTQRDGAPLCMQHPPAPPAHSGVPLSCLLAVKLWRHSLVGLTAATSAPGLGSPCHICAGTGRRAASSAVAAPVAHPSPTDRSATEAAQSVSTDRAIHLSGAAASCSTSPSGRARRRSSRSSFRGTFRIARCAAPQRTLAEPIGSPLPLRARFAPARGLVSLQPKRLANSPAGTPPHATAARCARNTTQHHSCCAVSLRHPR